MTKETIDFSAFEKLDLRVAEIKKVEKVEGADKLYKLTIDVGELGERIILAGVKEHYSEDDLIGKKIVIIANLESRKLKGIESEGMLLAASSENKDKVVLLEPGKDIDVGSKVS
tara:strand:+ start:199 stop:540 length:342 start_codon:yes stop_codon:yes gene_type:complete